MRPNAPAPDALLEAKRRTVATAVAEPGVSPLYFWDADVCGLPGQRVSPGRPSKPVPSLGTLGGCPVIDETVLRDPVKMHRLATHNGIEARILGLRVCKRDSAHGSLGGTQSAKFLNRRTWAAASGVMVCVRDVGEEA